MSSTPTLPAPGGRRPRWVEATVLLVAVVVVVVVIAAMPAWLDEWERHASTVIFVGTIAILGIFLLVTRGIPQLKRSMQERRIATLKHAGVGGTVAGAHPVPAGGRYIVDPSELATREGTRSYMRAGPPEFIDLEFDEGTRPTGGSTWKGLGAPLPARREVPVDPNSLETRKLAALARAAEMLESGYAGAAIASLEEAKACAIKLGHDDEAVDLATRIDALKRDGA